MYEVKLSIGYHTVTMRVDDFITATIMGQMFLDNAHDEDGKEAEVTITKRKEEENE